MATHNFMHVTGYLLSDPIVHSNVLTGSDLVKFSIRTVRRHSEQYVGNSIYYDLVVYSDDPVITPVLKALKKYDLIDIMKAVFMILSVNKRSECTNCHAINTKYNGTASVVYPIAVRKVDSYSIQHDMDIELPKKMLEQHYREVSNMALIVGSVNSDPELRGSENHPCCRYRLRVDRKFFIPTQGDIERDYPWVYSFDKQANSDYKYLKKGTSVLIDGYMRYRKIYTDIVCETCGESYQYKDQACEFIPYSVEYLNNYRSDSEIENEKTEKMEEQRIQAEKEIFGQF